MKEKSYIKLQTKRLDDLMKVEYVRLSTQLNSEVKRIDETIKLNAAASTSLQIAESRRLDAIRSVDINAVAVASERASQQATVLANQVTASAETLRALVATTATTVAQQLATLSSQLSDRITTLEKTQYEGIGKGRITDPQIESLISEVRTLQNNQANKDGSGTGIKNLWQIAVIIVGFAITIYFSLHK